MTSRSDSAYGRAALTRSWVRFILEVATISSVRVILRVFSTDLMRPLSSRPFAMLEVRLRDAGVGGRRERLLERLDALLELGLDFLRERLAGADAVTDLRELGGHELLEALLPRAHLVDRHVVDEAVRERVD